MTHLGIDIGTSGVKALLLGPDQRVLATAHRGLTWSCPHPGWAEQSPEAWWTATLDALAEVREADPVGWRGLQSIALSGQMHGATLLDAQGRVLRPAILWNDTRAFAECRAMEEACPDARRITGNLVMPGFTAPKLLWVRHHEPQVFDAVRKVLLPKDYLAYRLSGEFITDMSDASGTAWFDVAERRWSPALLAATGLSAEAMPTAVEGCRAAAQLRPGLQREWGIDHPVQIAAGAGDNAATAVGMGVVDAGQAMISLGTSGVLFAGNDRFLPNAEEGVHAFCHCLPRRWHQMTVMLSAAASLSWLSGLTGVGAAELASRAASVDPVKAPLFLPYLSGERSPHNDPHARGVFFGLTPACGAPELAYAVMEGVAFGLADGQQALANAGTLLTHAALSGGGSRSAFWARLVASITGLQLQVPAGSELGGAFGAARLAMLAVRGEAALREVCTAPAAGSLHTPDERLREILLRRLERYRRLYRSLQGEFQAFEALG